jgi:hypothetical protein
MFSLEHPFGYKPREWMYVFIEDSYPPDLPFVGCSRAVFFVRSATSDLATGRHHARLFADAVAKRIVAVP